MAARQLEDIGAIEEVDVGSYELVDAKRACLVDNEELRTIHLTSTKKWEVEGIPTSCEIWEEELLDMVGIVREGVPRVRPLNEKTTEEIAEQQNWPRPIVYTAKVRMKNGEFVPHDSLLEAERDSRNEHCEEDCACVSPVNGEEFDGNDESYPPSKKPLISGASHQNDDSSDEYVDVDGMVEASRFHVPSSSREATIPARRSYVPRGTLSKEDVLQKLLLEVDSLKNQIINSANSVSPFTLHYVLLRLKTLRPMIGHVSPSLNRPDTGYRSDFCQAERETPAVGSVLPFEVLSDDEDIALSAGGAFEYNSHIWR
ncbi:hypothetical protein GCK32_012280 [Trichostrongylus colubriformis]|uniref:Uncharacterized protein n=1 Tax=Trichostrongylus colubriformis TaxID=6319 RepID=A0AAN8GC49_TRICO